MRRRREISRVIGLPRRHQARGIGALLILVGLLAGTMACGPVVAYGVIMNDDHSATSSAAVPADVVGVKAGDSIKVRYEITGRPAGQPPPGWLKCEFLKVEGTSAAVLVTMRISDGTEQRETVPVDITRG